MTRSDHDSHSPSGVRGERSLPCDREFITAVLDHAGALVVVLDRDGRIVYFNRACEQLSGYRFAEVEGRFPWDTVLPPEDAATVRAQAFAALANNPRGDVTSRYTNYWVCKSGERRLIEWSNTLLLGADGRMEHMVALGIDITERRRAEEAVRRSEALLRHTQQIAETGSWELELANNRLDWSEETFRIFGLQPGHDVDLYRLFHDAVHPGDREMVDRAYQEAIERRQPYDISHRIVLPDGAIKWVQERGETLYDEHGRPLRTVGAVQDISRRRQAEDELLASNQLIGAVLDTTPVLIAFLDTRMNFVRVNRAYAAADRKQPEDFVGRNHFDLYPNPDNEAIFRRVAATGEPYAVSAKPFGYERNPERGVTHWDWTLTPLKDSAGRVTGLVLSLLDVAKRIKAIEALQRSEHQLKELNDSLELRVHERASALHDALELNAQVLAASSVGIAAYQASGECVFANAAIARLVNATPEQLLAQNFRNLDSWRQSGLLALALAALDSDKPGHGEFQVATSFGHVAWFDCSMIRFQRAGRPHLLLMMQDISARKQAEAELAQQGRRNELILNTTLDGFFSADGHGRIQDVNEAYCRMLGYTRAELLALSVPDIEQNESTEDVAAHIRKVIRNGHDRFDTRHRRKDGSAVEVEVSVSIALVGGQQLFVAFVRDITARKQAKAALVQARDQAERANRAKSEFLSRMSHELRTPMNAILGFAQVLDQEPLSPEQYEFVHEIGAAGEHLLELINELLDLARIESGRFATHLEPVMLDPALRQAQRMVTPLLEQMNVTLLNQCGPEIAVLADPTRLRQVLVNLLSNAAKYNRRGGSIRIDCAACDGQRLRLRVTDTGAGIAPELIGQLFMPFERLGAESRGIEGTGIGLALSRRLMELMGGTIGVESMPGQGSCFWIELAAAPGTQPAASPESPQPAAPVPDSERRRILYIEDNAANLKVIEAMLRHRPDLSLISATSGEYGLELARRYHPDLILLDIHLPGIDGYAVLQALLAGHETRDIPVVALSADAMPIDIEQGLQAGFRDYLAKPVKREALLAVVRKLLATTGGQDRPR
jgi:PAS domain S-box-containing protein